MCLSHEAKSGIGHKDSGLSSQNKRAVLMSWEIMRVFAFLKEGSMDVRRRASQESNIEYVSEYGKYIEGNDSHGIIASSPCIGIIVHICHKVPENDEGIAYATTQ